MTRFVPLIFFLVIWVAAAQAQRIDSLNILLNSTSNPAEKGKLLVEIAEEHFNNKNYQNAISSIRQSNKLAIQSGSEQLLNLNNLRLAKYYYHMGDEKAALVYLKLYSIQNEARRVEAKDKYIARLENLNSLEVKALEEQIQEKKVLLDELNKKGDRLLDENIQFKWFTFLLLLITLMLGGFIGYKRYLFRTEELNQKKLKQQKEELNSLKESIAEKDQWITQIEHQLFEGSGYAHLTQEALFSKSKDIVEVFPNSFILDKPKEEAGGDFYWFTSTETHHLLAVADCMATGIKGGFLSLLVNNLLGQIVLTGKITSPNMILTLLDQNLKQRLDPEKNEIYSGYGIGIAICAINKNKAEVEYSGAKFTVYYSLNGEIEATTGNQFPAGNIYHNEKFYASETIKLKKGDMLYLATDGFQNQYGGKSNKKFMRPAFLKLLASVDKQKVKEQHFVIEKVFKDWKGRKEQTEDILFIGLQL